MSLENLESARVFRADVPSISCIVPSHRGAVDSEFVAIFILYSIQIGNTIDTYTL